MAAPRRNARDDFNDDLTWENQPTYFDLLRDEAMRRHFGDSYDAATHPLLGLPADRIGKDRRRFIILSIFDFSLLFLLWLICTVTNGGDDITARFLEEINIFSPQFMHDSLFDVVIVVFLRMFVLIICYAALRLEHWLPVAITTGTTSFYLIVKVMFFFAHKQSGGSSEVPQYLLVVASFIVAWVELWYMPFRVLPRERDATRRVFDEEPSEAGSRNVRTRSVIPFSEDEFRSALDFSSDDSDAEDTRQRAPRSNGQPSTHQHKKARYIKAASTAETESRKLLDQVSRWRALRSHDPFVRQSDLKGAFYVKSTFACSSRVLWQAVWKDNCKWNDQVLDAKEVLPVDSRTVLFYSVSAPAMRGYIASRDFLDVRRIDEDTESGTFSGYFMSVDSTLLPPNTNKKIVRGTNGPSMMRVYPASGPGGNPLANGGGGGGEGEGGEGGGVEEVQYATLEWIMQTELKGGLPKRVVQSNMLSFFVNAMARLRVYIHMQHAAADD